MRTSIFTIGVCAILLTHAKVSLSQESKQRETAEQLIQKLVTVKVEDFVPVPSAQPSRAWFSQYKDMFFQSPTLHQITHIPDPKSKGRFLARPPEATVIYDFPPGRQILEIRETSDRLRKMGFDSIPALVAHLKDRDYSHSVNWSQSSDKSVGVACYEILASITHPPVCGDRKAIPEDQWKQIKVDRLRMGTDGKWHLVPGGWRSYMSILIYWDKFMTRDTVHKWWRLYEGTSLDHIHFDAINRLIERELEIGFTDEATKQKYLKPYYDYRDQLEAKLSKR